jgi:transcriptional regulator with XRE-family HTH domain
MQSHKPKQNSLVIYRRRMGFTQKHVARLLGQRDTSMISHYEHNRALPPLAVALTLEIIYRVPVAFLFPAMYDEIKLRTRQHEERLAGTGQQRLPLL